MLPNRKLNLLFTVFVLIGLVLAGCQPAPVPAPAPTIDETQVASAVNATLTAEALAVPASPTPVPSLTPFTSPTPTVPSPTATLVPVAGDPASELGAPDGVDTFDSATNFAPMNTRCFISDIANGQFAVAAKGIAGIYCWTTSWPTIQDFYIETSAVMPDVCAPDDNFGLLFRSISSSDGYLLGLNCRGEYSLKRVSGGSITALIQDTASNAIQVGPGKVNRMGVVAFAGSYYLYANGQYLNYATDFTFTGPGEIGYYVNAVSTSPFTSRYADMKVWKLTDAYYPSSAPAPAYPPVPVEAPASGAPVVTATTAVNVRSGPSTDYPVLGVASTGMAAEVAGTSPDGAWYQVKISTSVDPSGLGWVSADYVTLSNPNNIAIPVVQAPPPPVEVSSSAPASGVPYATALDAVNVRSGPSTDYAIYGVAPVGATAPVKGISADGTWYVITIPVSYSADSTGWVSAAFASLTGAAPADLPVIQAPAAPAEVVAPTPTP